MELTTEERATLAPLREAVAQAQIRRHEILATQQALGQRAEALLREEVLAEAALRQALEGVFRAHGIDHAKDNWDFDGPRMTLSKVKKS